MVDQLMLQRETLLGRAVAPVEQWRHDDALVQHANRHGTVHGLALYDADAAELLGIALAWAGTDAEPEGAVGRLVPDKECDRAAGPSSATDRHPLPGSREELSVGKRSVLTGRSRGCALHEKKNN